MGIFSQELFLGKMESFIFNIMMVGPFFSFFLLYQLGLQEYKKWEKSVKEKALSLLLELDA